VIERVLLIVNTESGTGCSPALGVALLDAFRESDARPADIELAIVRDHPSARRCAKEFAAGTGRRVAVIAAGGGGTVRAAVEGVIDARAEQRAILGALRLGSGNVLARRLGVARDPLAGIGQLSGALGVNRVHRVQVIRCDHGGDGVRHALVMCGLGHWGRTSGDLARWHARAGGARAAVAAVAGIERVNHAEYVAAAAMRLVESAIAPRTCELVEAAQGSSTERFRLLAGAAVTGRVPGLPFDSGVVLVPRAGRPRRLSLANGALRVTLLDRECVEFFLDEDPEVAHGAITLELAGSIPFLTAEVAQ